MLASAGVSFVEALEVVGHIANNSKVSGISKQLQESIETGNTVAEALKYHSNFSSYNRSVGCFRQTGWDVA
ncbi:MAG: type II secretion system F family protein [Planctomycetota bacterium]|jgi:type II secretory pathway component PulF